VPVAKDSFRSVARLLSMPFHRLRRCSAFATAAVATFSKTLFAASAHAACLLAVFLFVIQPKMAYANPAADAASFTRTTAGAISTTVPDGICSMRAVVTGAGGASSGTTATLGGRGGAGAVIGATFKVLPLQAVTGTVGAGGTQNNTNTVATGGAGYSAGGNGGLIGAGASHRGGGGGGSSGLVVAGVPLIIAGAGGGAGAAHQAVPIGNGGNAGFTGIAAGSAVAGATGSPGSQTGATVGGGQGGQAAAAGTGGVLTPGSTPSSNGFNGVGGVGGAGGTDIGFDSGGGGGGGYFGGGGGAATSVDSVTGGGGGGGSSFVAGNGTGVLAAAPTSVTGSVGTATAGGVVAGSAGSTTIDWVPCVYTLTVSKSASPTAVNAGGKTVWTVTVTNTGPDPMTRGDRITLGDLLPAGPNGAVTPQFEVLSISTSGGSNPDLVSGAVTCAGLSVGAAMPTSTVCSRPYSAPSAPGAPSGGVRGLNAGESLTITYEQVISNTAPCGSISNTASVVDRSGTSGTTDIIGVTANRSATSALTISCYDLAVAKSVSQPVIGAGQTLTWTVEVTNLGPGPMSGQDDPAANNLVVSDVAPSGNVTAPVSFTSSGPASSCTYSAGTINCLSGLAAGQTQTFTFQQTVNAGTPNNTVISNTATVTDSRTGDTNDSSQASSTVRAVSTVTLTKVSNGGVGPFTFTGDNGWAIQTITTAVSGTGVTGSSQTLAAAGNATTITEAIPAGYALASATCTGMGTGGTATPDLASGALVLNPAATAPGSNIACTFTNTRLPSVTLTKVSNGGVGGFTFDGDNGFGVAETITTVTSGTGVAGATRTLAAASTATTITETIPAGWQLVSVTCTGTGGGTQPTVNTATGAIAFTAAQTAPGSAIACTVTNGFIAYTVAKSASAATITAPGTITYTMTVTNTGGALLTGTAFSDSLAQGVTSKSLTTGPAFVSGDAANAGVFDPGEAWTYTATYNVSQAEIDEGGTFANIFTFDTAQSSPQNSNTALTAVTRTPDMTVAKSSNTPGPLVVGQLLTFSYLVTNTGNVTLSGVGIEETVFNGTGGTGALTPTGGVASLAPGASTTFTANYTVTQNDVDTLQ
jgi:uncharacterized repeat protein (TIGR01451 family)